MYDFHHYHSTAHEVLGFVAGFARLMLGGENGYDVMVRAGDAAFFPPVQVIAGSRPVGASWWSGVPARTAVGHLPPGPGPGEIVV